MSTITQFPSGNTQYRIEFDYLARTFIVVTLVNSSNPTLNRVLEVGRDYRFLNPTMIEMLVDQSGFDIVRIHRQTGTDLVVDFRNGSVLTASDLTNAELQAIHIAEEGRDQTVDLAKEYADAAGSSAGNAKDSEDEARRIAERIKAAGLLGYITRRSFEQGFNVTTWNEVLLWEQDGEYYRWDGALPKTVPAGSTPATTGGVGIGAWVSVGDASLRRELSQPGGSSLIGGIEITAESFGVVSGSVSAAVAKSNADKIMQKAAELSAAGGGKILFPRSLYQVHMNESDFSPSAATIRVAALKIPYDNVILCGQGWDATVIQAYATNSAYGVIQWSKAPLENGITKVHGVGLHNICIDGNYHGDFTPASYVRQTEGIVGAGIEGLSINNLKVKNCSHYGMGLQNGGYKGCIIDGYWSENTGADGIDIKDNGSVSRAFQLNNIFVFNFGQLDEPANPWAGVDVMSIAPKVSNVYVSDFGNVGCPGAGVRIKQGPIGDLAGRGSSAWANVSDITVVQNRFGSAYTTLIGLHIKAPFVNFNNIVAIGYEGGRLKNGVWIEERHSRGSNIQIANAEDGLSVTSSTSGTADGRQYGDGDDTVINGLVCRDVNRAAIINRKYVKLSGITFKDCPVGFVSGGSGAGKVTIKGVHLDNVPNPFGLMGGTHHIITDVTGPSSGDWQAGTGVIKGASDFVATTIMSKNSIRLYSGSTDGALGTEVARFASTVSEVFSTLRITGNLQPVAANTYSVGTNSFPWAGGYTRTAFTVTSDERQKSRPVMLARGSLDFDASSDERLMQMPYADDILDAWEEVDFVQFQFIDRIEVKGDDGARWHFGIIAQRAKEAFERHGLDPHKFAFFCYDPEETIPAVYESVPAKYEVVPAVYDADGNQVSPELWEMTEPAHEKLVAESYVIGEKYGIRYEEALVLEAALQRRNYERLAARVEALEEASHCT